MVEDYKEFKKWYSEFTEKNGGGFEADKKWFDKVQESHKKLRKFLGGVRKSEEINLSNMTNKVHIADDVVLNDVIYYLNCAIPSLNETCKNDYTFLSKPDFALPTGKTVKTTKYLTRLFEDVYKGKGHTSGYIANCRQDLTTALDKLGRIFSETKVDGIKLDVNISTSARAFALLGHFTCDDDSCFKQEGCNVTHKYILGQTPNTYVVIIKQNGKNVARFWGFSSEKFDIFNVNNMYLKEGTKQGNIVNALSRFFGNILETGENLPNIFKNKADSDGSLYLNDGGVYAFSKLKTIEDQVIRAVVKGVGETITCPHCHQEFAENADDEWEYVDEELVCLDCKKLATYCGYADFDSEYTFKKTIKTEHGVMTESTFKDEFCKCIHCEKIFEQCYAKEVNKGRWVCHECIDKLYVDSDKTKCGYSLKKEKELV